MSIAACSNHQGTKTNVLPISATLSLNVPMQLTAQNWKKGCAWFSRIRKLSTYLDSDLWWFQYNFFFSTSLITTLWILSEYWTKIGKTDEKIENFTQKLLLTWWTQFIPHIFRQSALFLMACQWPVVACKGDSWCRIIEAHAWCMFSCPLSFLHFSFYSTLLLSTVAWHL